MQVCRALGGIALGTAGSAAKRTHLRSTGMRCVHASRSTEFAEVLVEAGGGGRPQAILNSLTSPGDQREVTHALLHSTFEDHR